MCLAQGPQRSDASEARTRGSSISSQTLYHWATALPELNCDNGFSYHLLCLISFPLGAIFWMRKVIVTFTDHLLCLIALPFGAIFWIVNGDRGIYWPFTLFNFPFFWCHILDENCDSGIYWPFTLFNFPSFGCHILDENCDSGIYWPFTLLCFASSWCHILE